MPAPPILLVSLIAPVASARNVQEQLNYTPSKEMNPAKGNMMLHTGGLNASAVQGTTFLGEWTFDSGGSCINEGWVSVDLTVQTGDYWHIDDFAGLGGGDFGGLHATQGTKSFWCGARPDGGSLDLCGYGTLPGG